MTNSAKKHSQNTVVDDRYRLVPVTEITTPKNMHVVYVDHWWIVNERDEVMLYRVPGSRIHASPQCNAGEGAARLIRDKLYPTCRVVQLRAAYVPHDCEH